MTTTSDTNLAWMSGDELAQLGFALGGPERDYGMRWGQNNTVRVSYAPHADADRSGGFLYAYDKAGDRYALLSPDTTPEEVELTWPYLASVDEPEGYRRLVQLLARVEPMHLDDARELLSHCLDRELGAVRARDEPESGPLTRPALASHALYGRAARLAAQDLLLDAVAAAEPEQFLVVEYRATGADNLVGHVASLSPRSAVEDIALVRRIAAEHGYDIDVVNFTHRGITTSVGVEPRPARVPATIEM